MTTLPLQASSAIVVHEGRFLLVLRANPPGKGVYAFPGGRAEAGETPEETAIRELEEETGLRGRNPRFFTAYDLPPSADGGVGFYLSVFEIDAEWPETATAADDADALGWYSVEEMRQIAVLPSVLECAERIAGTIS
jgi:ADP-ribose pyrophosphatase YjhB (NUDIX family)